MQIKKIVSMLLTSVLLVSLIGCKKGESLLTDGSNMSIENTDYGSKIRTEALALRNFKSNNRGFNVAGSSQDNAQADYIVNRFEQIGLNNIRKESINLDGWDITDLTFQFDCSCEDDVGEQTFHNIGVYPSDFEYNETSFEIVNVGSFLTNKDINVKNKGVLLNSSDNLKQEIEIAIKRDAVFVVYNDINDFLSNACKVDMGLDLPNSIPIFSLPKINYDILEKELKDKNILEVKLTGKSVLTKNIKSDFIIGEIEGKIKDEYIYITANRDSIFEGFLSSKVSVGELICLAELLKNQNFIPKYTIRFMVTTGQEFGEIGKKNNIGIQRYIDGLDNTTLKKIKYCIVLDGSKPLIGSVLTEYQTSDNILNQMLNNINDDIKKLNLGYMTTINEISSSYITEGLVWAEYNIPVIIQAEPITSNYHYIENSSKDESSLQIESNYCNYLMIYMYEILKSLNK